MQFPGIDISRLLGINCLANNHVKRETSAKLRYSKHQQAIWCANARIIKYSNRVAFPVFHMLSGEWFAARRSFTAATSISAHA
jgi:hypothetical protein